MALHFHLKVNNATISYVEIRRTTGGTDPDDVNTYRWIYDPVHAFGVLSGEVTHRYGDGAIALAHRALGEILAAQPGDLPPNGIAARPLELDGDR